MSADEGSRAHPDVSKVIADAKAIGIAVGTESIEGVLLNLRVMQEHLATLRGELGDPAEAGS